MRSLRRAVTLMVLGALLTPLAACGQDKAPQSAAQLYRTGKYVEAIRAAEEAVAADSTHPAGLVLVRALSDVGRWKDAAAVGERLSGRPSLLSGALAIAVGRAHRALGDDRTAGTWFTRGLRSRDSLTARYELAQLVFDAGRHEDAMRAFDGFIDVYNENRRALSAADLRAVALSVRMLGRRDPQLFKDAIRAFDQSIAADSMELDAGVELGQMLLEKFSYADALKALTAVLAVNPNHPRALLVMARLDAAEGRSTGPARVAKSLEVNPHDPEAHALVAMQAVDVEQYAEAVTAAKRGLAADSGAPAPWIAIAAARLLSGDSTGHVQALARAHARLPGSARAEVTLADVMARNRLYARAASFAQQGVARDSLDARAHSLLGINDMRTGRVEEGRAHLDRSFKLDPYDAWAFNTLKLLDDFKDYTEIKTPRFVVLVETKDAPLMEIFTAPLVEAAYDSLAARYGFRPTPPVRVEMFRSSADFSVRAVGLEGLGALGVSFGNVVAMDSPAARKVGEFNWGSTLWHELTHTFTLGVTGNRVPRWVSEGLSVYEERRARPEWGAAITPSLVAAWKAGKLNPVSKLNNGFLRPRFPEEIGLSYALASYVCEMLEAEYGIAGVRTFLKAFTDGKTANQAFEQVARVGIEAFDKRFDDWFRKKFVAEFKAVDAVTSGEGREQVVKWEGPLFVAMRSAATAVAGQQWDEAVRLLESAKGMFPAWADAGSPYHLLAEVHLKRGDTTAAIRELTAITQRSETAFEENLQLSRLLRGRGDVAGAVQAMERTLWISPFDAAVHDSLASLASANRMHAQAIQARRALVALRPTDRAEALYQLARAYADAGDVASARREVLRALDLAPNFEKAQELLLSLRNPEVRR
ncbi:MAG: tetratricopeptide repeat protein [Gemmatimonadetes bacterium]|nr:tetratricopeptide repeat protein [Gemmatimonadota bacterium]